MTVSDKIQLTDEKETLFIPLAGKALDYRSKNSVLNDSKANDIVEKVGIEFTTHKRIGARIGTEHLLFVQSNMMNGRKILLQKIKMQ